MEKDKVYPAKFVKYGQMWSEATGYWKEMARGLTILIFFVAISIFVIKTMPLTMPTIIILSVLAIGGAYGYSKYHWGRFKYYEDSSPISILVRPKWDKMGGYDIVPKGEKSVND